MLIKKFEAVTKTKGGIVIPEKAQGKVLQGTVVAVGTGPRLQVYNILLLMKFYSVNTPQMLEI